MKVFLAFLMVAVCALVASPASAACSAADVTALEALDRQWGKSSTDGDRAALEALFAEDYGGISPTGIEGKADSIHAALADAERARKSPSSGTLTHDHYVIACTPASATITHRNVITDGNGGAPFYTRSVHFLEKRGGKWQVVSNATHPLDDSMAIAYLEQEWTVADLARDGAWKDRNFASDYTSVGSRTGAMMNKAEEIDDTRNGKYVLQSGGTTDLDIRVDGNSAVATGIFHAKGKGEDGKAFDRRIRFTDTYVKRDGRWQVWASQGTLIAN
jgi:ketosteroid isomerase-like protein